MWLPPGFPGASVLWFFQLFLRRGRPGGPSIRCSILRFAAIWPAPGCSVLLFFGFRSASRLARVSCAPLGLARGSIGAPPGHPGDSEVRFRGPQRARSGVFGCSFFFGFRVAPRRARSPPHADSLRRGAVCLARHQIWCLSATPKACRTQTVWSPRGAALRAPSGRSLVSNRLRPRGVAVCARA